MPTEDEMLRDSMMAGSGIVPAEEPEPKPKPSYRIRSVDPKGGDIDQQFALIETEKSYGAPASASGMRRIGVGDELPEGSVTAITPEGIRVIPDYEGSEEYVIPLGREGYEPPEPKKEPESFSIQQQQKADWISRRMARMLEEGVSFGDAIEEAERDASNAWQGNPRERFFDRMARQEYLNKAGQEQGKFYDTDDPNEVVAMVQEDFAAAFSDDKTLEMTETPDGMQFLFEDEDGNISSYFQDNEGDAIRMTPESGTVAAYTIPQMSPMTAFEELVEMAEIQAAADSL